MVIKGKDIFDRVVNVTLEIDTTKASYYPIRHSSFIGFFKNRGLKMERVILYTEEVKERTTFANLDQVFAEGIWTSDLYGLIGEYFKQNDGVLVELRPFTEIE